MIKLQKLILAACLILSCSILHAQQAQIGEHDFERINLSYPGLDKVRQQVSSGHYDQAADLLLDYYRHRTNVRLTEYNIADRTKYTGKPLSAVVQEKADKALLHQFQPHKGYGYFDYGKDINWQLWPVKDNEVRWQLHRVTWWQPMGLAYWSTGDEKYAKEWVYQFRDWVKKNPLGLSKDNDQYAWRPLEVSERIQSLPATFNMFINSPNFTSRFLLEFLNSYDEQAAYIPPHYTDKGNHLLFEAQRVITAGCFFPELKNSEGLRKSGVGILNREITKQVYPDGMQFELSPTYHNATIDIFLNALRSTQMSGETNDFPVSYQKTVENMILATINFSFPDYTFPMFGDSWLTEKAAALKQYRSWAGAFPDNQVIRYFATDHQQGTPPSYLSHGLTTAGFYTFRSGWENNATVMVLKASPPGEFHAQPDNGTFELWVKGRNFTPDAGVYVYSGDAEINKLREAYRQTKVHQTLTLDDQNMVITKAQLQKWVTSSTRDVLTYTNPSYPEMEHRRSVLFIDQQYFIIIDKAAGSATGKLGVHFQLKEDSKPIFDTVKNAVHTNYTDDNNLLIHSFNGKLKEEPGKVSYQYRKEIARPAFVFEQQKTDSKPRYFITVVYPYQGQVAPTISIKENPASQLETGHLDLSVGINGKTFRVTENLIR
jgi:heparan-sulfate lyase